MKRNIALAALTVYVAAITVIFSTAVDDIRSALTTQNQINREVRAEVESLSMQRSKIVTVSAYSPREIETDSTPFETSFLKAVSLRTAALPWSLIQEGWLPGNCIYLKINDWQYGGIYKINDMMDSRWHHTVDLFFFDTNHAYRFGRLQNVEMIYLGECP